ncbi:MAG: HAD family acid phosphatase [Solirubrobacterales bacterium]
MEESGFKRERRGRSVRRLRAAILIVAAFGAGSAVTAAIAGNGSSDESRVVSLRPTGVGLPDIGATHTFGAEALPTEIRRYHDSGEYDSDLNDIGGQARAYLRKQLNRLKHNESRGTYKKCKRKRGKRRCKPIDPAVVLDIDETSLSHYADLNDADFNSDALVLAVVEADSPAIQTTLGLYRVAQQRDVSVFLITGRPPPTRELTESNLQLAGYEQPYELALKPSEATVLEFKSGERARIEDEGFTILVNMGDQDSDLNGGHAKRAFKLPNPMYYIPGASYS